MHRIARPLMVMAALLGTSNLHGQVVRTYSCAEHGTFCDAKIPANAPADTYGFSAPSYINVPDLAPGGAILDVNVSIKILHESRGNVRAYLRHELSGLSIVLFENVGSLGNNNDDMEVKLDDEATGNVDGQPCSSQYICVGTFKPESPNKLSSFDGLDPASNWRLLFSDTGIGGVGQLVSWSVELTLLDTDGDGVPDGTDRCTFVTNPEQSDIDGDGVGDPCDNCRALGNLDQIDSDADGVGDACDRCVLVFNPDQLDSDDDGHGDVCDNCPMAANYSQRDDDGNAIGNACEPAASAPPAESENNGSGVPQDDPAQAVDPGTGEPIEGSAAAEESAVSPTGEGMTACGAGACGPVNLAQAMLCFAAVPMLRGRRRGRA